MEGDHYRVHVHFDAPAIGAEALEIVEATWDLAALVHELDEGPGRLLDVHLYRGAADYQAAEEKLTGGFFRKNLAFAHWNSKSAHVALQPPLSDEALAEVGLPYLTARFLSHEAAHLVRFEAMPNYRYHPAWFADGSATWVEVRVLARLGRLEVPAEDPMWCSDVGLAQALIASERMPAVAGVLAGETAQLGFYERYSVHWLLFEMLADRHGGPLTRAREEIRTFQGDGSSKRATEAYRRSFGLEFDELDADFAAYVGALDASWREVYRSLETAGEEWVHAAFAETNATALRTAPIRWSTFRLSGELTILDGGEGRMHLLLGYLDTKSVRLSFIAGQGVYVRDLQGQPTMIDGPEVDVVRRGEPFTFDVIYTAGTLRIEIDGRPVFDRWAPLNTGGVWGLSADSGSAGIWRNVRLER
jgi:hypothetical protein